MDNLTIGAILIAVGILLAILAYVVMIGRRGEAEEEKTAPGAAAQAGETLGPVAEVPPSVPEPEERPAPAISVPLVPEPPPAPAGAPPLQAVRATPAPMLTPAAQPSTPPRRTIPVATLLRDEVTGKLIVQVGGREYYLASELRESRDWHRVEYAAADLVQWLGGPPAGRAGEAGRGPRPLAKSMIDQINTILERKLAESPQGLKGVRLVEGTGGALRVFVGLQSYAFDEVPDPEVRKVIREAVAEWENPR
jgi:hypothetical protein